MEFVQPAPNLQLIAVSCLLCKVKFNAFDCNTEQMDICNASFYKLYKPLAEKLGNNAQRPGNFTFVCDICLTKMEINESATCDNKLHMIQDKVLKLESGIQQISTLLQKSMTNVLENKMVPDADVNDASTSEKNIYCPSGK